MVDAEVPVFGLLIIKLFPPVFSPSKVALSAPFKEISAPLTVPEIVLAAPPEGDMVRVFEPVHCISSTAPVSEERSEVIRAVRLLAIPLL